MAKTTKKLPPAKRLAAYRQRAKNSGVQRVEVTVPASDATYIRSIARAFRTGGKEAERFRRQSKMIDRPKAPRTGEEFLAFLRRGIVEREEFELPPRTYEEPRNTGF